MLVYLDSNIVIYLIEQPAQFGPRASARITALAAAGDRIVVSDLTRLECRANAVAAGDQVTLAQYDAFFSQAVERVMPLTASVVDRATIIRGRHRFKTPDALHLAAAVEAGCQAFLTNDARLSGFSDFTVEPLP
ncbi:MAG: type II toxin-antitoxin system VapC family toxin [Thermoguttaceae bacterium]